MMRSSPNGQAVGHGLPEAGSAELDYRQLQVPPGAAWPPSLPQVGPVEEPASPFEPYLRGPIPLYWLLRAMPIRGKAFALTGLLWHLRSLQRSRRVRLEPAWYAVFGLHRHTVRRLLQRFQRAGLVQLYPQPGRPPDVELVVRQPPPSSGSEERDGHQT